MIQRGSPHFGDDVPENIVLLCGSGTWLCHGAHHGSPYSVFAADGTETRRDAAWVNKRIGRYLLNRRPDVIDYVLVKMGDTPGRDFLDRVYQVTPGTI